MGILDGGKKAKERESIMMARIQEAELKITRLKIQESILEGDKATWETSSQVYKTRDGIIGELDKKFKGIADWGNELVSVIAKTRAAFALSGGVDIHPSTEEEKDSEEIRFIGAFVENNELDGAKLQDFGIEKVLEGQLLFGLDWVANEDLEYGGFVRITHYPYLETKYEVKFIDGIPDRGIKRVEWEDSDGKTQHLRGEVAVFIRFNNRVNEKIGWPDIGGGILTAIDRISKNLDHWRALNWLFSHPTAYFKTETREEATDLYSWLTDEDINWRIGKILATPAEFSLVSGKAGDWVSIKEEITRDVQFVSAHTTVPVQFLGFPELMSNRATADNTMEPVALVSQSEQKSWKDGYDEMFDKAIGVFNSNATVGSKTLRTGIIQAEFSFVTQQQLEMLVTLFMPMRQAGDLSLDTLLGMIPGIQAEEEMKKIEAEKQAEADRVGAMASDLLSNEREETEEENDDYGDNEDDNEEETG